MTNDKEITKAEEIELLQRFTVMARRRGAPYLHDALIALSGSFESVIQSDFPGAEAAFNAESVRREAVESLAALEEGRKKLFLEVEELKQKNKEERATAYRIKSEHDEVVKRINALARSV